MIQRAVTCPPLQGKGVTIEDALEQLYPYFKLKPGRYSFQHCVEILRDGIERRLVAENSSPQAAGYIAGTQLVRAANENRFGDDACGDFFRDVGAAWAKFIYADHQERIILPTFRDLGYRAHDKLRKPVLELLPEKERGKLANTYAAELLVQNGTRSIDVYSRMQAHTAHEYLTHLLLP